LLPEIFRVHITTWRTFFYSGKTFMSSRDGKNPRIGFQYHCNRLQEHFRTTVPFLVHLKTIYKKKYISLPPITMQGMVK